MTDHQNIEERIAARTDLAVAGSTAVSASVGGLAFKDMGQVMEFSKLMAVAGQAVPKHLRAAPGACLAVSLQALNWRMDPFAVANKSYMVNDRIAYEAQLIHAVIEQRAPIKGRIKGKLSGDGATRKWTLTAQPVDDEEPIVFEGVEFGKIKTKNSPLWQADPDQQLWYYTVRAMARRHFPDVIMGVYEKEEMQAESGMKDVTPEARPQSRLQQMVAQARGAEAPVDPAPVEEAEVLPAGHWTDEEPADFFPGSDAFNEGATDFQNGHAAATCPYDQGSDAANDWLGGWHGARRAAE